MISAKEVVRGFKVAGGETFYALKGISMEAPEGKLTILKGRSGSGKTTLINILGALDAPTSGSVFLDKREISSMDEAERARLRRTEIGFIFQSVALIPMMTAAENVEFALRLSKVRMSAAKRRDRALECLKMVGLLSRAQHMPLELSGGEQQRVAVARAIAHNPKVLFADEPTAELDTNTGLQVVKIFKDLARESRITIVMTTHDKGLMEIGDAVYELEDGEIIHAE